ncbi:toxic anion resistance protein [Methylicorpusculum sp.]|uniref:toxic anion resistance protein n=1 Tax=Methylicorpusculum sp. TaxID=2713644 RepID=UPI002730F8FF|nr:toxic anion resistance protein [Methylicorpusculum sp.]MDP2180635.1 toxic anion resistance protein [Methylicorpusculum sp.]MDP3530446.1 toxic anion resistance protein [Methylicorpusculum sp.]MDZ4152308.1 toxic anion resistance protein [Methylicorpusculum sp.]
MSEQQDQVITSAPVQIDETQLPPAQELVPGVQAGIVSFQEAPAEKKQKISQLLQEIDIKDTHSILFFGSKAQEQLTTVSDRMLEGVKNKDTGPAGEDLNAMVATIRGFEIDDLDPNKKQGFFSKLMGKAKPVVKFVQQYEEVRKQIDSITDKLERHKTSLLTDIASLDRLYQANLDYFHSLEDYIAAGEEKLRELDNLIIPEQAKLAESSQEVITSQNLRDLRSMRDDLERRVHDLRLTRQVSMQSLPSIRLVQENDKGLVNKINSTIVNTIPLWRQQLATAVTIFRSSQAAETVKAATDLTNDLLAANAENLKQANAETRKQLERGVFDIETVKQANQALIATIEESLQIADLGKKMRSEAVVQLQQCEAELRKTLASAQASPSTKV